MLKDKIIPVIAILALIIAIIGFFPRTVGVVKNIGAIGTNAIENYVPAIKYNEGFYSELPVTTTDLVTASTLKVGSAGTTVSKFIAPANCTIIASANTIAASTTKDVDCAVTGLVAGDFVTAFATTSISTASNGVAIVAARASTTAGYATLTLSNLTGATFTWTATASTSVKAFVIR